METLFVSNYLHSNIFVVLIVKAFQGLAKASFAQEVYHLVSVANMVMHSDLIIPFVIVVAVVKPSRVSMFIVLLLEWRPFYLLRLKA